MVVRRKNYTLTPTYTAGWARERSRSIILNRVQHSWLKQRYFTCCLHNFSQHFLGRAGREGFVQKSQLVRPVFHVLSITSRFSRCLIPPFVPPFLHFPPPPPP